MGHLSLSDGHDLPDAHQDIRDALIGRPICPSWWPPLCSNSMPHKSPWSCAWLAASVSR